MFVSGIFFVPPEPGRTSIFYVILSCEQMTESYCLQFPIKALALTHSVCRETRTPPAAEPAAINSVTQGISHLCQALYGSHFSAT